MLFERAGFLSVKKVQFCDGYLLDLLQSNLKRGRMWAGTNYLSQLQCILLYILKKLMTVGD